MDNKNHEDIKDGVNSIEQSLTSLEKQKVVLQDNCDHKCEVIVKFDDKKSVVKVCSICNSELGYASKSEIDNFLKQ